MSEAEATAGDEPSAYLLVPDPGFWESPEGQAVIRGVAEAMATRERQLMLALGEALMPDIMDLLLAIAALGHRITRIKAMHREYRRRGKARARRRRRG